MSYPNATYTLDENNPYGQGSYVYYSCDHGYKMEGDSDIVIRVCIMTDEQEMQWNGPDVKCNGKVVQMVTG